MGVDLLPALLKFRPGGINVFFDGETGTEIEDHSSTCSHCQALTAFPSRRVMMDHVDICRGCMKLICLKCVGKPCVPYERRAEMAETEHYINSRIHMQAWRCY
jgi:hypothetical protein